MKIVLTICAFAGGLLGLGNYVSDGWTMLSGGRNLYAVSNAASVILLIIAGSGAASILARGRGRMTEEDRKEHLATLVLSAAALAVLGAWILFRALRAS
jgi:hypothetical protein